MRTRVFALLRTLIVAPLFLSIWTYFLPRWIAGSNAFADPRLFGWIVVAVGAAIGLPCVWEFAWRGLGTPAPFDPPRKLVVTGPYRYVRNPMYVGMGIALIGEAIVFPHLTRVLLVMVAVLWAVITSFVMFFEEPMLRSMFGADYAVYCAQVRRWIPRLKPFDKPQAAA
ncbi:MAG: methyltransferase family protein [Thermoanaerobaculia bacterium]